MTEAKSVKISYDVAGGDFDRAGEASSGIKRMLQKIGIPADIVRRIAIGTYEAEMNVLIHAGGGKVAAEIFQDHTVINITDHGPGIPDAEKARVFDRFYSADPSRTDKHNFGLGLSVAKELARLHHADLTVTDTPGGGAKFAVTFAARIS